MISNLIDFGKYLVKTNQEDFGFYVNDDDVILHVKYNDDSNSFNFDIIDKKKNISFGFLKDSYFNTKLPTPLSSQDITISNQAGLMGFSPFVLKLDHDFLGRKIKRENYNNEENFFEFGSERYTLKKRSNKIKLNSFAGKIKLTYEQNKKGNQFNKFVNLVFEDIYENFLKRINLFKDSSIYENNFFNKFNSDSLTNLINSYFEFLFLNTNNIIKYIINYEMCSDDVSLRNRNFFIVCSFGDEKDLLNDFFYDYCKFFKEKNDSIDPFDDGNCSFCGRKGIINPNFNYLSKNNIYFFNSNMSVENSRLRICKNCNSLALFGLSKLENVLDVPNLMIIPQQKNDNDFEEFIKISNVECNSFKKLNKFLLNHDDYNYDLMIYKKGKSITDIKKYIENYKSFLVKFNNLKLYGEDGCKYLFNEKLPKNFVTVSINNLFDLETIFRNFFFKIKNGHIYYLNNNFYFYQIYTRELVGDSGLLSNLDSKMILSFFKYMENIFNFIYELNEDAINKTMINEIVLNALTYIEKYNNRDENGFYLFRANIIKIINYYFMFCNEFLEDTMLDKKSVEQLNNYLQDDVDLEKIYDLINENVALKYYIIGQFIRQIDNFKFKNGKNSNVFSNFINNTNKNNIKKSFSDILLNNEYYIKFMNKKGKVIFEIIKEDYDSLFDETKLKYEDYVLLIFSGYYTNNLLY